MNDRPFEDVMIDIYKENPKLAVEMLNSILEDGEQWELMLALRHMPKAFGGVRGVAKDANLNPNQLYRTLSEKGNPELKSLTAILRAMGMRLAVQPLQTA
jgi:probable addiction module antidote protein